ncbi:hypothetical protein MMC29_003809 [Sticta canariensis]|nr:hypothetical protein [Sticta canariensis]
MGAFLLKTEPQTGEETIRIRSVDSALFTIFRGILDIIQIPEHLDRELEYSEDAGRDTDWVHMKARCGDTVERFGGLSRLTDARDKQGHDGDGRSWACGSFNAKRKRQASALDDDRTYPGTRLTSVLVISNALRKVKRA